MTAVVQRAPGREIAWGGACALAGVLFTLFLYALNHRAFFSDDTQEAFAPIFMAIGRSLAHGHWPALTLQMLNGGALADEYQYAIYNPFSLLADFVASHLADQGQAEALIVGLHYAVMGAGAYAFARVCGAARPWAALAAVTFGADNFIYYWLAESWITGLVGFAWMTWALAGLMRAHESRWAFLVATLATALTATSGCYHVSVILGVGLAVIAVVRWRTFGPRTAAGPILAGALGVLMALPALLPVMAMGAVAIRSGGLANSGRLAMDLYGVLDPSAPFHMGHFLGWDHFQAIGAPIYFAGWFVLPLLPLIDWRRLGRPTPALIVLVAMIGLFVIATQGPEQLFSVRFPIWYLAPLHLALLVAFAVLASQVGFVAPTRRRLWAVGLIVYFGWLASLQVLPESRGPAFLSAVIILGLVALGTWLGRRSSLGYAVAGLVGTVAFVGLTHLLIRINPAQPDRGSPTAVTAISDLAAIPTTASAYLGSVDFAARTKAPEISTGAMALAHGGANPFGYSPFGQHAFSYRFMIQLWGTPLDGSESNLFQPSGLGSATWADLLRIDSVVIPRVDDRPARVAALAGPGWRPTSSTSHTVTLSRISPAPRGPGSVAWTSPGLALQPAGPASAEHETLRVLARSGHGDRVVFDREAWPGYRVSFAGRALPLAMTATPLMTVTLPDGPTLGELTVSYAPPHAALGLLATGVALATLIAAMAFWPRFYSPLPVGRDRDALRALG